MIFLFYLHYAYRNQRSEQETSALKVREEINGLIQELRDLKKEQTGLSNDLDQLKARRTEVSEKLVISRNFLVLKNVGQFSVFT